MRAEPHLGQLHRHFSRRPLSTHVRQVPQRDGGKNEEFAEAYASVFGDRILGYGGGGASPVGGGCRRCEGSIWKRRPEREGRNVAFGKRISSRGDHWNGRSVQFQKRSVQPVPLGCHCRRV